MQAPKCWLMTDDRDCLLKREVLKEDAYRSAVTAWRGFHVDHASTSEKKEKDAITAMNHPVSKARELPFAKPGRSLKVTEWRRRGRLEFTLL
jgi:hypothetical protein